MYINNTSHINPYINQGQQNNTRVSGAPDQVEKNRQTKADKTEKSPENKSAPKKSEENLTEYEEKIVEKLKKRDQEVRAHEMAHVAAGGSYIMRGANYQYQKGPDGGMYAVGGDVLIDTSPVPGDPQATMRKMDAVRNAALAPANPSNSDRAIASNAVTTKLKASEEMIKLQLEKSGIESGEKTNSVTASKSYSENSEKNTDTGSLVSISA